jgi:hypothetical protein
MAFADKLKDLRSKAEEAVVERKDQINQAVQKAGEVADQRTGGKYHDQIQKVGGKAVGILEGLEEPGAGGAAHETPGTGAPAPAADGAAAAPPEGTPTPPAP